MSDPVSLLVPMTVEALVVNNPLRLGGRAFLRNQMEYAALARMRSADPGFDLNDIAFTQSGRVGPYDVPAADYFNGVYLKWRLPSYFTRGIQDSVTGATTYRRVPNRWLIVRYSGPLTARVATSWIVESDYLWPSAPSPYNISQQASHFVTPTSASDPTPVASQIGRNVKLGAWQEPGTSLDLQAIGPGNPAFSAYQPHCNNVFSFVDCINDQPAQDLAYLVLGWFSDDRSDPLYGVTPQTFAARLAALGWSLPPATAPADIATQSFLYGITRGVSWQTTQLPPGGAPSGTTALAMGNTSIEALTALVSAQSEQMGKDVDPAILQAFQLGLIDELDQADGLAVIDQAIRESYFGRYDGGYVWSIHNAPGADDTPSEAELQRERIWLAQLNDTQAQLDEARRQLASLQQQLYVMWWKYIVWPQDHKGTSYITKLNDRNNLAEQLDAGVEGSLAAQTIQQRDLVASLLAQVPTGDTQKQLQEAIRLYEAKQELPAYRELKRSGAVTFYEPNNPVVLIAGAGAAGIVDADHTTLCRLSSQLVTGFTFTADQKKYSVPADTPGLQIPQPDLSGVTGVPWSTTFVASLVKEMFVLDPDDAAAVAAALPGVDAGVIRSAMADPANDTGVFPTGAVQAWTANPWHPLRLLYEVRYYPIGYGPAENPNWRFAGGQYYWNGASGSVGNDIIFSGTIQLSPTASFNLRSRIVKFLDDNPFLPKEELQEFTDLIKFIDDSNHWDLLSQSMNGFNEQAHLQQPGVYLSPDAFALPGTTPLAPLTGDQRGWAPNLGNIPLTPPLQSLFQPWRSGQFVVLNLALVDEWGQALWLVSTNNFHRVNLFLPPTLSPVSTSNAIPFTVTATPIVSSASPAIAAAGSGPMQLQLQGAAFQPNDVVSWNGVAMATVVGSATALQATIPAAQLAAPIVAQLAIVRGTQSWPALSYPVVSGPTIASLEPSLVLAGMAQFADFPLAIAGANFSSDAVVQWNGTALDTSYVNASTLRARVPAANVATRGTVSITVASNGATSPPVPMTIETVTTIGSVEPRAIQQGQAGATIDVYGVGFEPASRLQWNGSDLVTTFVDTTHLSAAVPAGYLGAAATVQLQEVLGFSALPESPETVVQLTPGLLQPSRLAFDLVSATQQIEPPLGTVEDPVCGWVVPNHLDHALSAYSADGVSFGALALGASVAGSSHVCWTNAPGSPYSSLEQLAAAVPHFGPFLLQLQQLTPVQFADFLRAVDETLWNAAPAGAAMDHNLTALIGRPLAMVRASVQLQIAGTPEPDPSWQYTFSPAAPLFTSYEFGVALGDISNTEDGLVGYFVGDDYQHFNIVQESAATSDGYLRPIGVDDNYLYLAANDTTTYLSMLVDPRAKVHARSGILPDVSVTVPGHLVTEAFANMEITYRVMAVLTDQQTTAETAPNPDVTTVFMPYPSVSSGTWTWVEHQGETIVSYPVAASGTTATLSTAQPKLRQGVLQLTGAVGTQTSVTTRQRLSASGLLRRRKR